MDRRNCPGCWNLVGERDPSCRTCGLPLTAPQTDELRLVQAEITGIDTAVRDLQERRAELDERRTRLLLHLREQQKKGRKRGEAAPSSASGHASASARVADPARGSDAASDTGSASSPIPASASSLASPSSAASAPASVPAQVPAWPGTGLEFTVRIGASEQGASRQDASPQQDPSHQGGPEHSAAEHGGAEQSGSAQDPHQDWPPRHAGAQPGAAVPSTGGTASSSSEKPEKEARKPRRDLSRYAVQNLLLLLGGLLLGIAAIVFTVVSWGHPNIRAASLVAVTVGTLAFPWLLVRRRLHSTAETVAYIGLVFVPLAALAVVNAFSGRSAAPEDMDLPGSDDTGWWTAAGGSAALAMFWAGYARIAPLRLPAPTALTLAQAPLPLVAIALGPTPTGSALALILTAAFDLVVWARATRKAEQAVAAVAGLALGAVGVTTVLVQSFLVSSAGGALRTCGVLALAVLVTAVYGSLLRKGLWRGIASGVSGVCAVAFCATPVAEALPGTWVVVAYTASACLVLVGVVQLPARLRLGAGAAVVLCLALTVVWVLPEVLVNAFAPLPWGVDADAWDSEGPRAALGFGAQGSEAIGTPASPLVLAAASLTVLLLYRRHVRHRRLSGEAAEVVPVAVWKAVSDRALHAGARGAALALASSAVLALPVALDLPYDVSVTVVLALTIALLAVAAVSRDTDFAAVATIFGVHAAVLASVWPLGEGSLWPVAELVVTVAFLAFAFPARTKVAQVVAAAGAVLTGAVFVVALWGTYTRLEFEYLPFALLGVRLVAVVVALPAGGPPRALARAVTESRRNLRTLLLGTVFFIVRAVPPGAALRARRPAQGVALDIASAVVSLVAVLIGAVMLPLEGIGSTWASILGLTLAAAALLGAATAWSSRRAGSSPTWAIAGTYLFAALAPLPLSDAFFPALFGPYGWLAKTWAGTSDSARAALTPEAAWISRPMLMPVLVLAALAAIGAAGAHRGRWAALGVAQVAIPVALAPAPLAADLPYWAALSFLVALTAGLALWAARNRAPAGGAALWTATLAVSWSLADQTATLAVLAALAMAGMVCMLRGGNSPVASAASAVTTLAIGAEGAAAALAGHMPARNAAFVVLVVAALAVRAGALIGSRRPGIAHALDAGALVLWSSALVMTGGHDLQITLVLAMGGLTAVMSAARLRGQARLAVLGFAWSSSGLALLLHLPRLFGSIFEPYTWAGRTWSADTSLFGESSLLDDLGPSVPPAAAAAAALAAVTVITGARVLGGARGGYRAAALAVPAALLVLPRTVELSYGAGLGMVCVLLAALAARTVLVRTADLFAGAMALWLATLAVAWSLPMTVTTLGVVAGVAVLGIGCALVARNDVARCGASATAVLASAGLVVAAVLAAGLGVELAGLAVLVAVAAPTALGAWEVGRRHRTAGLALELAGYGAAAAGVCLACTGVTYACLALTGAGVLALAVAARGDRRVPGLGAAAVLLHAALWLLLGDSGVTAPEAYTTSVSVLLVVVGWWAQHRDAALSSWSAHGPALALTLVPSLVVAWNDDGLVRPLLLGLAAFAVTLAGAWVRMQAPLLLGGAVLVVNAAHELFPALADLVGSGPRWLPIALTGAALLFAGATYEHRRRDIRRVRRSIADMR